MLCTQPYSHSTCLFNQEELPSPISNLQFAVAPHLLPHTPQTHPAYPSHCSMIIHMAMRLDRALQGCHSVMGVFPDDDLGALQLPCQEQGIQT